MKNKRIWLYLPLLLAIFAMTSMSDFCGFSDIEPVRNLECEVIPGADGKPGGGLLVKWDYPYDWDYSDNGSGCFGGKKKNSDYFLVSVDGDSLLISDTNFCYVYTPCQIIEVVAVQDGNESYSSRPIDLSVFGTDYLDVYCEIDPSPEHPSGFGFDTNGYCRGYTLLDQEHLSDIDFFIGSNEDTFPCFVSPHQHTPNPLNTRHNSTCQINTLYDTLKIVPPATSEDFSYMNHIQANGVYGFWLDDDGIYDTSSRFGKIFVTGIDGYKVTLRLAYQLIPGLRWVVAGP